VATFVLVHGSYQGGWIWKPLGERLLAAGHTVYRPTLDGCAERKGGLRKEITLKTHGVEIANLFFYEDLNAVLLVGTSSGGMVVCQAAEHVPERVGRLVFIDALVPRPGELVATINGRPLHNRDELVYGPRPEEARGRVYADLPADLQEWALARYTQHPLPPTEDPVDLASFWSMKWQADVLRCTRSTAPPEAHQRRTAELLGGTYAEIDAGHYPMLSNTDEIARYLLERV
jgi:pimeloyl-ACP methyl ester carboxylesterase